MLSKRIFAQSFYETTCPCCQYRTTFNASNLVQREYFSPCSDRVDYGVIDSDIKCQLCMRRFLPIRHRPANSMVNPTDLRLNPAQWNLVSQMSAYLAVSPDEGGWYSLSQVVSQMRHDPQFDDMSIFLADKFVTEDSLFAICIVGHNLTPGMLSNQLGLTNICPVPIVAAMDFHSYYLAKVVGDVSHVTRI